MTAEKKESITHFLYHGHSACNFGMNRKSNDMTAIMRDVNCLKCKKTHGWRNVAKIENYKEPDRVPNKHPACKRPTVTHYGVYLNNGKEGEKKPFPVCNTTCDEIKLAFSPLGVTCKKCMKSQMYKKAEKKLLNQPKPSDNTIEDQQREATENMKFVAKTIGADIMERHIRRTTLDCISKATDKQVGGGHYKDMPIQPVEFCQKNQLNLCESAVVKYVCRHKNKNGREDIKKAIHFLELLLEIEYPDVNPDTGEIQL